MTEEGATGQEVVVILPPSFSVVQLLRESTWELRNHFRAWVHIICIPFGLLWVGYGLLIYTHPGFLKGQELGVWELFYVPQKVSFLYLLDILGPPLCLMGASLLAWSVLTVAGSRLVLCGEHKKWLTFEWTGAYQKIFVYSCVFELGVCVLVMGIVALWFFSGFLAAEGLLGPSGFFVYLPCLIFGASLGGFYLLGRIALYAQAIALNYPHPLGVSWRFTKGYVGNVMGGYLLILTGEVVGWSILRIAAYCSPDADGAVRFGCVLILILLISSLHLLKMVWVTAYFSKIFQKLEHLKHCSERPSI